MTEAHASILQRPEDFAHANFTFVVRRLADDLAFGSDNSRLLGSGLEYASSRPYQPGDSIRAINWRLTARTGKAFVKEYEALKRTCVFIVVDTSASASVASTALSKIDLATWIAAALGLVAQRRLSPVSILGGTRQRGGSRRSASLSQHDLWRDLEPLRRKDFSESAHLARRIRDIARHAERASVIVAISDWHDADAVPAMRHAAQRHDCIALHTIDPAERDPLRVGFFRGREAETGHAFLGRSGAHWPSAQEVQSQLVRSGVDYLAIHTDRPFIPPLRHFLSSRAAAGRMRG